MNARFTVRASAVLSIAIATILGGCASSPERIEELEAAQAVVAQVEASPRAGVAARQVSEARKSLDRAIQEADRGHLENAKYHANVARANAQIANEKIVTAQAQETLQKGTAERERVVAEARTREAQLAQQRAATAQQQATTAQQQAASLQQELRDLKAHQTERGLVLTLGDVLFDTGKARLKPGAFGTIDRLANALKEVPTRTLLIEGHTDSVGSEEYNQQLSEERARAVQSALMARGVSAQQITAAGRGESLPVASNDTPGGRQQNRRVELIFNDTQQPAPRVATDTD